MNEVTYQVAKSGYQLCTFYVEGAKQKVRKVIGLTAVDEGKGFDSFQPFKSREHSGMFLAFADTPATPEGVLSLANRYGFLVGPVLALGNRGGQESSDPFHTEILDAWGRNILALRHCVDLWKALTGDQGAARAVAPCFHLVEEGGPMDYRPQVRTLPGEEGWNYADPESEPTGNLEVDASRQPLRGRLLPAGELQTAIRQALRGHVDGQLRAHTHGRFLNTESGEGLEVLLAPKHLLGSLWLQLAQAVQEGKQFLPCASCGTWFEDPGGGGRKAKFCSHACKMRAYRAAGKA